METFSYVRTYQIKLKTLKYQVIIAIFSPFKNVMNYFLQKFVDIKTFQNLSKMILLRQSNRSFFLLTGAGCCVTTVV